MNYINNITFRRTRTQSEPNNDDSDDIISQSLEQTTSSLPEVSEDEDNNEIKILKEKIDSLTSQLNSAHKEIESLSLENSNLKKQNEEFTKKNMVYKKIANSPAKVKVMTPKNITKKLTKTKQTQTIRISENDSASENNLTNGNDNSLGNTNTKVIRDTQKCPSKPKICLISSETSSMLHNLATTTGLQNYDMCHYRKPKCGLEQLLDKIDGKVKDFTHSDFCIIYIGEEDFLKTRNYIELVIFIREKLLNLTHTNFIICLPTFKYMENANIMFNSRIETFNNLLYMDTITHCYAHILDSNLNLPYSYDTYNLRYKTLNKHGLKIVVSDLQNLIIDICDLNIAHSEVDYSILNQNKISAKQKPINSQFFL